MSYVPFLPALALSSLQNPAKSYSQAWRGGFSQLSLGLPHPFQGGGVAQVGG